MVRPANVGEIAARLAQQLREWPALAQARVEDSEPVNESPDRCPWVGVYRSRVAFPTRTLGVGTGYRRQEITILLVMNEASTQSGLDAKDRLESLIQEVASALLSDESIGGTVLVVDTVDLTYSNYAQVGASFMQHAVLSVTATTHPTATP